MRNFWSDLMETDEHAANYMLSYDEGPGTALRYKIAEHLNPEEWVLDVGCGPGWNFDHFLEYGPSVYYRGMDYSERFVRVANQRAAPLQVFKLGDVRQIPEPDDSYDVVIFQDVLEHTNGYEKPLDEAIRVARKRIIVTFWHLMDKEEDNPVNDDGNDGWGAWYSKPKWERFLDSLPYKWTHERLPRKDAYHDLYCIYIEETDGKL